MARPCTEDWRQLAISARYDSRNLAELIKITPRQLQRIFRNEFGQTPQDWLNEQRILAAKQLLRTGEAVKKIALDLGFKQSSHFCRQFKILNGLTPSEFRNLATNSWMSLRDNNVANG